MKPKHTPEQMDAIVKSILINLSRRGPLMARDLAGIIGERPLVVGRYLARLKKEGLLKYESMYRFSIERKKSVEIREWRLVSDQSISSYIHPKKRLGDDHERWMEYWNPKNKQARNPFMRRTS